MIKAIIFDLDNCLSPATEVGEALYQPAFDAMREANHGHLPEATLRAAFDDCWRHPLDWVAGKYAFPPAMLAAGWRVFTTLEVHHLLHGYGDLSVLPTLPASLFLVTTGFRRLQETKITALGIERHFTAIHIDALDSPHRIGKSGFFHRILHNHHLLPAESLVVGDSPHSEIAAGRRLGMPTVQILRPGVTHTKDATHHIHSLAGLPPLLGR